MKITESLGAEIKEHAKAGMPHRLIAEWCVKERGVKLSKAGVTKFLRVTDPARDHSIDKAATKKAHERPVVGATGHLAIGQKRPRKPGQGPRLQTAKQAQITAQRKLNGAKAIVMKARGASNSEIAATLGYASSGAISDLLAQEYAATPVPAISELRKEAADVARLVRKKMMAILLDPDADEQVRIGASKSILAAEARLAKLFGLDAPTKTEVTGADGGPVQVKDVGSRALIRKRLADIREELLARTASGQSERATSTSGAVDGGAPGNAATEGAGGGAT